MKKIVYIISLVQLFVVLSTATSSYAQEAQSLDKAALQAMLALNYCHTSLVNILTYEDRIVLDEEYHNIINNINLAVIDDEEVLGILTKLMDTLIDLKLNEGDKALLLREYDTHVSRTFYTTIGKNLFNTANVMKYAAGIRAIMKAANNLFLLDDLKEIATSVVPLGSPGGGPIGGLVGIVGSLANMAIRTTALSTISSTIAPFVVLHALTNIGGTYQDYRNHTSDYRDALERKIWELEKHQITTIHELRKEFLVVYWKLMKKYNIPDQWRLTEDQLRYFLEVKEEQEPEKRWRMLQAVQRNFAVFPPFWYALAQTAIAADQPEDALRLYQKIEQERLPFFREDHSFSDALMHKVLLIQAMQQDQPGLLRTSGIQANLVRDLQRIIENSPNDWRKNLFVALQYARLQQYDAAETLLVRNIDHNKAVSLNLRVLGEVYAVSQREQQLCTLITGMTQNEQVRYQDTLYLLGKIRDENMLHTSLDSILKPLLSTIHAQLDHDSLNPFAESTLIITLPEIFIKSGMENTKIFLRCPDQGRVFAPEKHPETDQDAGISRLRLRFKGVLDQEDMLEHRAHKILTLKLSDGLETLSLRIDVNVRDVIVDENLIDKTSKAIETVTKSVTGLFSKDKNSSSEARVKTKPEIYFTFKELVTSSGVCYRVNDDGLGRLNSCNVQVVM